MQRRYIMSQKKVDAYKARKGQHSKADKKEKMLFGLEMFAWAFICVVIDWLFCICQSNRSQRECGSEYSNGYYCA
jgi:hypothetical protein